jgi:hypothetical protein
MTPADMTPVELTPADMTRAEDSQSPHDPRTPLRQPAQPRGVPTTPRGRRPAPPPGRDVLGTAVQAAAELAEIGLSLGARALRGAAARVPRP